MSKFRLRSYDLNPPGNYPYEQTTGIYHQFPALPLIEAQATTVQQFRAGNGLPRASFLECLEDVDSYQCQRLGNPTRFCVETDAAQPIVALNESSPAIAPPCRGCGAPVT